MVLFPKLVVFLRFLVDYLLLLGSARLCDHPIRLWRAVTAAALGAVYVFGCIGLGLTFLGSFFWHLIWQGLMCMVAFGMDLRTVKPALLYLLLSVGIGCFALGLGKEGHISKFLCFAALIVLCIQGIWAGRPKKTYLPVSIRHGDRVVDLTALVDTGNMLTDPVSGNPVLVADAVTGTKLLGLSVEQLKDPVNTLQSAQIRGLRLIPYTAVGSPKGMLLGLRVDRLIIGGRHQNHVVAFAPQMLDGNKRYQALAGGNV